jgi:enamine deaminase RidA (YjgF/YER057c/UK114 family)
MNIEKKLGEMGLKLPEKPPAAGTYVGAVRSGNLVFVSGHGPVLVENGKVTYMRGKVGKDLTIEQGQEAARLVGLHILRSIKEVIGDLDKVSKFVKVLGFVNTAPGFTDQPKVINGASDLFVALYGDAGRHARSAIGMYELPFGIPVEIEAVVEVKD